MSSNSSATTGVDTSANQSIDQIRHILFGEESEAQRERIETLDKRLQQSLKNAKAEASARAAATDDSLAAVNVELTKQLAEEKRQRKADVAKLNKTIDDLRKNTEQSLTKLGDQLYGRITALQDELTTTLSSRAQDLQDQLDLASEQLEDRKTDRALLSELFSSMAEQLNPTNGPRKST